MNVYKNKGKVALTIDLVKIGEKCKSIATIMNILGIIAVINIVTISVMIFCGQEAAEIMLIGYGVLMTVGALSGVLLQFAAKKLTQ